MFIGMQFGHSSAIGSINTVSLGAATPLARAPVERRWGESSGKGNSFGFLLGANG
jgi:hypothetical protein